MSAPLEALCVGPMELDAAFPFHIVCDRELRIRSVGSVLSRLLPRFDESPPLGERFEVLRPARELRFEALTADPRALFLMRSRDEGRLTLRGQMLALRGGDRIAFLGAPRITIEQMRALGLSLSDFASHDSIADYLFLVQAQQASLSDTARLSDELARLNGELERRVHERTAALSATTGRLEAALDELAGANARLEEEMVERERMAGELRLAHRLEAVGQLAAGIAHEINTPTQYVSDSAYFLKDAFDDLARLVRDLRAASPPEVANEAWHACDADFLLEQGPKALQRAFDGLDRVTSIVKAMKAFAHPGSDEKAAADINAAIESTLAVSRNEYKYVADLETDLGELPLVTCQVAELNQVFLNLVVNAAHAVADRVAVTGVRGAIRIATRVDGASVLVTVADTGAGIPREVAERIFDPFFTTKPVGKGTGQGLTIARNIVVRHGGTLAFESTEGRGSVFSIRLPVGEDPHEHTVSHSVRG